MAKLSYVEAVRSAIHEEMARDPRVFVMGHDVRLMSHAKTRHEFAPGRIRNTPISEAGFIGAALGAALTGMRPVVELGCSTFLYSAMDQVVNQIAKSRYMFGGQFSVPLVIRAPVFYGISAAAHHSDRPWGLFAQAPGLKIIAPTTPHDAKGLMKAAIRDANPVLWFDDVSLFGAQGEVPEQDYAIPIGAAGVQREGTDVTIVAVAGAVERCLQAAGILASHNISAEIIDVRTIVPLDRETILGSVIKTGRLITVDPAPGMCSLAAEVSAVVAERAFDQLKGPIIRLTAPDVPVPFSPALEHQMYPSVSGIVAAARQLVSHRNCRIEMRRTG